jgi:hypothetical protein
MHLDAHNLHTLEFLNHDGTRTTNSESNLQLFENGNSYPSRLIWGTTHLYFICPETKYVARYKDKLVTSITFPRSVQVETYT